MSINKCAWWWTEGVFGLPSLHVHSDAALDADAFGVRGGEDGPAVDPADDIVDYPVVPIEIPVVSEDAPEPPEVIMPTRPKGKQQVSSSSLGLTAQNAVNDVHDDWVQSNNWKGHISPSKKIDPNANTESEPIETSKMFDWKRLLY